VTFFAIALLLEGSPSQEPQRIKSKVIVSGATGETDAVVADDNVTESAN
jgi:hypothetical protein